MLRAVFEYAEGGFDEFENILHLTLKRSEDTPADFLELVLPFALGKEISNIRLFDGDTCFFEGITDEQRVVFGNKVRTCIVARSMAALLLDNEACPEVFTNPSLALIFNRYGKPCGLEGFYGEDRVLRGVFKVSKGDSCYKVLKSFCERAFSASPEVLGGILYPLGLGDKKEIFFGGSEIPLAEAEMSCYRCRLVSEVYAKTEPDGAYATIIPDRESIERKVHRRRYVDASGLSADSIMKARNILKRGRLKAFEMTLIANLRCTDLLSCKARVLYEGREYKNLLVSDIRYTLKDRKEQTRIILRSREE